MEKQTPGATKRLPYTKFQSYPWFSEPPGDGDTECVSRKSIKLPVNESLGGLGDSRCSLPNGDVLAPGCSDSEGAVPEHKDRGCTTGRQHIRRLKVETYGPLLAAGVAVGEMDASEGELSNADDNEEDLGGVQDQHDYLNGTLPESTSCDWLPFQLDEKCYPANEDSEPDSCCFNCRCGTIDPQHLYSACRTCSCNLSSHHFHSENQGDFCADSQESPECREDEEEAQYDGAEEESRMQDGVHYTRKKTGKRQRNRVTTKEQEDWKEDTKREFRAPSVKHKASRKKSHVEGKRPLQSELLKQMEQLAIFCILYFKKFIDVVVTVTHRCGEYVEGAGGILYAFCQLKTHDFDSVKTLLKKLAQSMGQQTRSTLLRLKVWVCNWGPVILRLLKMLCALLFLVIMLFVGCLRLCWRHASSVVMAVADKVRWTTGDAAIFTSPHGLNFASRVWTSFGESRTCKYLTELLRKWVWRPWTSKRLWTDAKVAPDQTGSPSAAGRSVPSGEVERLLTLADVPEEDLNPFQVLGVEMTASDIELKKAYRQLAVLVHPDKNTHPRAEEAFKVLRAAWDIVNNPEKRKEYEIKRMSESELAKSMTELLSKLQDDLKEAMNTMMCSKCQGKHRRFEMERDPQVARYCADCSKSHPAEEGDFWAESSMLGLKITYFAMMDGKVYDITEWAGCQRVSISPDTHRVPYHISFGSKNTGTTGRSRTVPDSSPASAADLQDLFNRIFQGPPGPMPNGSFFTPPPQTAPPQGSSSPAPPKPDSVPKTETKPKRRKKVRRPFQR